MKGALPLSRRTRSKCLDCGAVASYARVRITRQKSEAQDIATAR